MLKVLGTGATSETCLLALNETSWDVHRAIKLCQVTRALGKQVSTAPPPLHRHVWYERAR